MPPPHFVCEGIQSLDHFPLVVLFIQVFHEHSLTFFATVDPSLIQPYDISNTTNTMATPYSNMAHTFQTRTHVFHPPSPAPSDASSQDSHLAGSARFKSGNASPYLRSATFHPYPHTPTARRPSMSSIHSRYSQDSPRSASIGFDEDNKDRSRCPNPDCGRLVKDLKAHMLTHQAERPEKCPIVTCEFHHRGFARKYDKQRHTLTHYKGTMVCGFCPGSGSAAEKSFNRADVFKRHLTSVHGVEQCPPNGRKKSPSAGSMKKITSYPSDSTGKCSTCSLTFGSAQDLYEHLDDCVLRVVRQEDPSEAINEARLREVAGDEAVQKTLGRHMLPSGLDQKSQPEMGLDDDEEEEEENDEEDDEDDDQGGSNDENWSKGVKASNRSGKGAIKTDKRVLSGQSTQTRGVNSQAGGGTSITKYSRNVPRGRGMTYSRGGVPLMVGKGRKKRKHYPASWGCPTEKMRMKRRVLRVYDGPRRLCKDEMMLDNEFEVRMRLGEGSSYVTDLDMVTVNRAEAFHNATEEEKGPWVPEDVEKLMT